MLSGFLSSVTHKRHAVETPMEQAFSIVRDLAEEDGGRHRDKCERLLKLLTSHELLHPGFVGEESFAKMDPQMAEWLGGNSMMRLPVPAPLPEAGTASDRRSSMRRSSIQSPDAIPEAEVAARESGHHCSPNWASSRLAPALAPRRPPAAAPDLYRSICSSPRTPSHMTFGVLPGSPRSRPRPTPQHSPHAAPHAAPHTPPRTHQPRSPPRTRRAPAQLARVLRRREHRVHGKLPG